MTVREILRLAIGGGIKFENPPPDTETYAPAPPPPPPEFIESLRTRAGGGDAEAQRELGILAYRGRGVPEDRCEAFKWLTLAARQGDPKAVQSLEFIGPTITTEEAYEGRVRISELTGEPPPPPVDDLDRDLDATPTPTPTQEQLYTQAIAAMRVQGLLDREETVVEPGADPDAPKYTFEPPPRPVVPPPPPRPLAWALTGLALLTLVGAIAAVLFFIGRDQRDIARVPGQGTYSLQSGGDGKITLSTTVPELRAAAEQDNAKAQFELGLAYARGVGVARDFAAAAAAWYRKAALQRDIGAMNNLGVLYIQGTGVKQDFTQGYLWLHLAAQGGSVGSGRNRDQLSLYMTADQIAEAMKQAAAIRQTWADGATPPAGAPPR